jgi:site-specific recombinase XerD
VHYDACPLGHAKLETTALYTRVAVNTVRDVKRRGIEVSEVDL